MERLAWTAEGRACLAQGVDVTGHLTALSPHAQEPSASQQVGWRTEDAVKRLEPSGMRSVSPAMIVLLPAFLSLLPLENLVS